MASRVIALCTYNYVIFDIVRICEFCNSPLDTFLVLRKQRMVQTEVKSVNCFSPTEELILNQIVKNGNTVGMFTEINTQYSVCSQYLFVTLCLLGNFVCFFCHCQFFSKSTFSKNSFSNTIRVQTVFGTRLFCSAWSGSKLLAKVINRRH